MLLSSAAAIAGSIGDLQQHSAVALTILRLLLAAHAAAKPCRRQERESRKPLEAA